MAVRMARLVEGLVQSSALLGRPEAHAALGLRVLPDDKPGCGPLGGVATALRVSDQDWNLILGCDLPFLTRDWLEYLMRRALDSRCDALLPADPQGNPEPLCAMYHRRGYPTIRQALDRGIRKVTDGLAGLAVDTLPHAEWKRFDSAARLFKNMNTPADYEEARRLLEGERRA
jgi:molybdopterin-guanine dinucleotide biosynthesis protein A